MLASQHMSEPNDAAQKANRQRMKLRVVSIALFALVIPFTMATERWCPRASGALFSIYVLIYFVTFILSWKRAWT